jgi:type I site-specific restriction endonuclease
MSTVGPAIGVQTDQLPCLGLLVRRFSLRKQGIHLARKDQQRFHPGVHPNEARSEVDIPTEIFLVRLNQLDRAVESSDIHAELIKEKLVEDIRRLPLTTSAIREHIRDVDIALSPDFWKMQSLDQSKFLRTRIAPLLRYQQNLDPEGANWTLNVERLGLAILTNDGREIARLKGQIVDSLTALSPSVKEVKEKLALRDQTVQAEFWRILTFDDVVMLASEFTGLMKFGKTRIRAIRSHGHRNRT